MEELLNPEDIEIVFTGEYAENISLFEETARRGFLMAAYKLVYNQTKNPLE